MIASIMQPAYLPWLGYFDRIARSDLHIVLDDVPLERSSKTRFTNRNRILTSSGPAWLTVPVLTTGLGQPQIKDVVIDNSRRWRWKHWASITNAYSPAPFFDQYALFFETLFAAEWAQLVPLLDATRTFLLEALGIGTEIKLSSDLHVPGSKSELILNLCKASGATTYLSGPFGRDYLDAAEFRKNDIDIEFHDYAHPTYVQRLPGFAPNLSIIDLLFNCGGSAKRLFRAPGIAQEPL